MRQAGGVRRAGGVAVRWERPYTRAEWLDLVPTTGGFTRMPQDVQAQILAGLGAAVDAAGGLFRHGLRDARGHRRPAGGLSGLTPGYGPGARPARPGRRAPRPTSARLATGPQRAAVPWRSGTSPDGRETAGKRCGGRCRRSRGGRPPAAACRRNAGRNRRRAAGGRRGPCRRMRYAVGRSCPPRRSAGKPAGGGSALRGAAGGERGQERGDRRASRTSRRGAARRSRGWAPGRRPGRPPGRGRGGRGPGTGPGRCQGRRGPGPGGCRTPSTRARCGAGARSRRTCAAATAGRWTPRGWPPTAPRRGRGG